MFLLIKISILINWLIIRILRILPAKNSNRVQSRNMRNSNWQRRQIFDLPCNNSSFIYSPKRQLLLRKVDPAKSRMWDFCLLCVFALAFEWWSLFNYLFIIIIIIIFSVCYLFELQRRFLINNSYWNQRMDNSRVL